MAGGFFGSGFKRAFKMEDFGGPHPRSWRRHRPLRLPDDHGHVCVPVLLELRGPAAGDGRPGLGGGCRPAHQHISTSTDGQGRRVPPHTIDAQIMLGQSTEDMPCVKPSKAAEVAEGRMQLCTKLIMVWGDLSAAGLNNAQRSSWVWLGLAASRAYSETRWPGVAVQQPAREVLVRCVCHIQYSNLVCLTRAGLRSCPHWPVMVCCAGSAAAGSPAAAGAVGQAGQRATGGGAAAGPSGAVLQGGTETDSCKQHEACDCSRCLACSCYMMAGARGYSCSRCTVCMLPMK